MANVAWLKKHRILAILMVIVFIVAGFLAYRQYEIRQEKQKFEQARASIDALYTEIVATAGEPDKSERSESCGYAERKFDRGPRSCGVSTDFVYGVNDNEEATEKFREIKEAIEKRNDIFKVTFTDEGETVPFTQLKPDRDQKMIGITIKESTTQLDCSFRFTYGHTISNYHFIHFEGSDENLSASISCGDDAMAEHYPVKSS